MTKVPIQLELEDFEIKALIRVIRTGMNFVIVPGDIKKKLKEYCNKLEKILENIESQNG